MKTGASERKPPPDELSRRIELQKHRDAADVVLKGAISTLLQNGVPPVPILSAVLDHIGHLWSVILRTAPPGWDPNPAIDEFLQEARRAIENPTGQPVPERKM